MAVFEAYTDGLDEAGLRANPRLVELGMCASAVKYDWLTPAMLASASTLKHVRYGGTEAIDPDFLYHERGLALLDNARRAPAALLRLLTRLIAGDSNPMIHEISWDALRRNSMRWGQTLLGGRSQTEPN